MEILKFQNIRPTQIRIYQMIKSKKMDINQAKIMGI